VWSVSRPGRFIPRERAPGTHWIGGWVGSRAALDAVVKIKIPSPYRGSKPRPSSPFPSAIPLSYPAPWSACRIVINTQTPRYSNSLTYSTELSLIRSCCCSVNIVPRIRVVRPGFDSRQGQSLLFTTASKTALGSTQSPIQWVTGTFILGVKRPDREIDHSPSSSAEVKE
jgi:hypothetical protein